MFDWLSVCMFRVNAGSVFVDRLITGIGNLQVACLFGPCDVSDVIRRIVND
jgi:hypothetical protein